MLVPGIEGRIGDKKFGRFASVEISSSMKVLGTTAVIKIPTTARLQRGKEFISEVETAQSFQVGDPVSIKFGYDGNLLEEFRGFVRRILPTTPLQIECEDEVFVLRRKRLQKSFRSVTLGQVLQFILADTGIEIVNELPLIQFSTFYLKNVNAAQAIEKLRKEYGLTIYFRSPGRLVVGLASETDGVIVNYVAGRNVINHSLEWEDEGNVTLKVKAINVSKENVFTEAETGDPQGDLRTIYLYNLEPGTNLKERAEQELIKYKFTGYRGTLTGFLIPSCQIGNTARFKDENFDNREGDYLVESVTTSLTTRGGRRKVKIGLKLDL